MRVLRHFNLLNVGLIVLLVMAGMYEQGLYKEKRPVRVAMKKVEPLQHEEVAIQEGQQLQDRGSYMLITDKNLFHQDRKLVLPVKTPPETQAPPPEFTVYGILMYPNATTVYVEDKKNPYSTQGRGTRQRRLHQGDTISGYTLQTITPEYVEFVSGEKTLRYMVVDHSKKKPRTGISPASPPVPQKGNPPHGAPPGMNTPPGTPPIPMPPMPGP
ncbi:MAG: hypothetical protein HQL61_04265 [Magnetococcales bacterium]|uniref:Uncharacterized protein n=1 Tax=Candidatus Magnetobacterium casense TaxID=1455061 RepID=A0ABS6RWV1_9BACT|nr:hypothetical protein [Candidatus Magnetobacterium casensis]MBF0606755.1 hypothetical protein [Nitrospirota bacterium]MBV6341114.1 hypothetical protein [Candidatus Magnetobacterium casensis]